MANEYATKRANSAYKCFVFRLGVTENRLQRGAI